MITGIICFIVVVMLISSSLYEINKIISNSEKE